MQVIDSGPGIAPEIADRLAVVPPTPVIEPEPLAVSPAYEKMQKKAAKLALKEGISEVSAFARIYADPANRTLLNEDKAHFFAKSARAA